VHPGTEAARLLLEYLEAAGETLTGFANSVGVDGGHLSRIIGHPEPHVTVALAVAIRDATNGAVPLETWLAAPSTPARNRRKAGRRPQGRRRPGA
jgi:hypothetical protein